MSARLPVPLCSSSSVNEAWLAGWTGHSQAATSVCVREREKERQPDSYRFAVSGAEYQLP